MLNAVFLLKIADVFMSPYGELDKTDAFAPMPARLFPDETVNQIFICLDEVNENRDVAIRYEYQDLFGNTYIQDVVFKYFETDYDIKRTILEMREVCQPQLKIKKVGRKEKHLKIGSLADTLTELGV